MKQRPFLIVLILIGLLAVGFGWQFQRHQGAEPAYAHGKKYPEPKAVPDVVLAGADGQPVRLADFSGKYVFMFFGYTHCPDVCPASLQNLAGELKAMGPAADKVQAMFVSVDPQRDTPAEVARYATYFHPDILGVTAPREEIDRLTKGVGAYYFLGSDAETGRDDYDVTHSMSVYVLNPQGRLAAVYSGDGKAGRIAQDFAFLAG